MTVETVSVESFLPMFRDWLRSNLDGAGAPVDAADLTYDQFARNRNFLRRLGERGWYAPGWPKELGGGGLPLPVCRAISRELAATISHIENVHPLGDIGATAAAAVWALGTEEQKQALLPSILRAEATTWELFTEPEAGSDLPSLKTQAVRDGDDYVITGSKIFVGGHFECEFLLCLAVTDPSAPRRKNLSAFMIPADLPGITITDLDMIAGSRKRAIALDGVRVPATYRIGREGDGWTVFTRPNAPRHFAGVGIGDARNNVDLEALRKLLKYWREQDAVRSGPQAAARRELLTRAWIDGEVQRLLRNRLRAISAARVPVTYERTQIVLNLKEHQLRLGKAIQRVLGPAASLNSAPLAPYDGELEYFQRYAILATHPGGTVEVQKLRLFREMQAKLGLGGEGH